ncbi:MAG: AEC family transporter [Roseburia sp.]|nr:AEC family transporter [Roseburia sp.]
MNVGIIFGQMLVLLTMMAVGFFCYKKGWVSDETSGHLSKLVVNVFNPILVVNGVLGQNSVEAGSGVAWNIMFIVVYFALLMLISLVLPLVLRPEEKHKSIYRLMTIFSNVGFMGIPVIKSIFGDGTMIYVAFYILGYNIMLYTVGMFLAQKTGDENRAHSVFYLEAMAANGAGKRTVAEEQQAIRDTLSLEKKSGVAAFLKRLINPGVVAALLAVAIFAFGIKMPDPVVTFCDYMGNTTIPLSMIMIGISMAQANLKEVFADVRIYAFILLRMIALPIAVTFALKGIVAAYAIDPIVFGVFIIELGMPVGSIIVMMSREKGGDAAYCTRGVVLSTLASIITIPLICAFL